MAGGTAIYGLLDGTAPSPTSETKASIVETRNPDRTGLFAASDDVPRVRIGDLIILPTSEPDIVLPLSEPDIVTGSVKPTAKPGQAAKKAKARKQTPKPAKAPTEIARKPASPPQQPNSLPADIATLALTGSISGAE
jgi:hypothetical protein